MTRIVSVLSPLNNGIDVLHYLREFKLHFAFDLDLRVTLLYVMSPITLFGSRPRLYPAGSGPMEILATVAEGVFLPARNILETIPKLRIETRAEVGSWVEITCRITNEQHYDIVLLGAQQPSLGDHLFGSVNEHIIREIKRPVVIVKCISPEKSVCLGDHYLCSF